MIFRNRGQLTLGGATFLAIIAMMMSTLVGTASATRVSPAKASGSTKYAPATITLASNAVSAFELDFYIAAEDGLYAKQGLTVNFTYASSPEPLLTSGAAQLLDQATLNTLDTALEGLPVQLVSGLQINTYFALISTPSVGSITALQALPNCTFGTTAPGNSAYAAAAQYIKTLHLTNCHIAVASGTTAEIAGLVSGAYSAIAATPQYIGETASQGTHALINPYIINKSGRAVNDPTFVKQYALPNAITAAIWGEPGWLKSHSGVMVRFMRATLQAQALRKKMTLAQMAQYAIEESAATFGTESAQDLRLTLLYGLPSVTEQPISRSLWDTSLGAYKYFDVPTYSASSPLISYKTIIDNSYIDKALNSLPKSKG